MAKTHRKQFKFMAIYVVLLLGLSACSKQIQNFVTSGDKRPSTVVELEPTTSSSKPAGIKVSPGSNAVQGSAIKAQMTISTTKQKLSGSQIQGTITFNQLRHE